MNVKNKKMNLKRPKNSEFRGFLMLDMNPSSSAHSTLPIFGRVFL